MRASYCCQAARCDEPNSGAEAKEAKAPDGAKEEEEEVRDEEEEAAAACHEKKKTTLMGGQHLD